MIATAHPKSKYKTFSPIASKKSTKAFVERYSPSDKTQSDWLICRSRKVPINKSARNPTAKEDMKTILFVLFDIMPPETLCVYFII